MSLQNLIAISGAGAILYWLFQSDNEATEKPAATSPAPAPATPAAAPATPPATGVSGLSKHKKLKEINSKISAKFNINRYGNKGHEIHSDNGKVLKVFNSKKTDFDNWLDAVKWGKRNIKKIRKKK